MLFQVSTSIKARPEPRPSAELPAQNRGVASRQEEEGRAREANKNSGHCPHERRILKPGSGLTER